MTCAHVQKKLTRYLERMCAKEEVISLARHIEFCPSCAQQLRDLQRVKCLLKKSQPMPIDPIFLSEIQTGIHERTTSVHLHPGLKQHTWIRQGHRLHYMMTMAAVLLFSTVSLTWHFMAEAAKPVAQAPLSDDIYLILQEHALQADQSVFTNGALGSVMVNQSRKK